MSNTHISFEEFCSKAHDLGGDEVVLDVRNPDEYASGHIMGAVNIPLPELAQRSQELASYKNIYIHCKRGGRAHTAFETLKAQGFKNLFCLAEAGMDKWIESGKPVSK